MNIIGGGGLSRQIKDVVNSFNTYSISYGGRVEAWSVQEHEDESRPYIIGFASLTNPEYRELQYECLVEQGKGIGTIISPKATVSPDVNIFPGTVILHNAFIGPGVKLEENVLVGTGAIVEHDSAIEAHSIVLTGAIINGGCVVGRNCMIGSGAILLHNITIANNVIVGAGTIVNKNITEPGTYVGCPARRIQSE